MVACHVDSSLALRMTAATMSGQRRRSVMLLRLARRKFILGRQPPEPVFERRAAVEIVGEEPLAEMAEQASGMSMRLAANEAVPERPITPPVRLIGRAWAFCAQAGVYRRAAGAPRLPPETSCGGPGTTQTIRRSRVAAA